MIQLKLALDWTPNINHIGFFVALEKGFYKDYEIHLDITDPSSDNYQLTPAKKVELGQVDFALCPTESVISYQTKRSSFDLIAIASILQEDLSAIVVKANDRILSPKDLDGKTYSSYAARYEDSIVKEMIINDGGKGHLSLIYPAKLGIWNTLLSGKADATWIFLNWEGIEALSLKEPLRYFKMKDYGIPYSYSPVIATSESSISSNKMVYTNFLKATKEGYLYGHHNPEEAVNILKKYVPKQDHGIDLRKALSSSLDAFGNDHNWGKIDHKVVETFLEWIKSKGLETSNIAATDIYTNSCW